MPATRPPKNLAAAALLAVLGCAATVATAAGRVEVRYVDAARFADIGFGTVERERSLKALSGYLEDLGKALADGQTLQIDVTDVDLAGTVEAWRPTPLRIMRGGADWPRIDLRWTLQSGATTLNSGQAALSDMAYLSGSPHADPRDGDLLYEKRMLKKWFDATFGGAAKNH